MSEEGQSPPDPTCPTAYLLRENRKLREAIFAVVRAVNRYLPPDGVPAQECISAVLAATDNPEINDIMARGAIYDRH